jgi:hypothetical protein
MPIISQIARGVFLLKNCECAPPSAHVTVYKSKLSRIFCRNIRDIFLNEGSMFWLGFGCLEFAENKGIKRVHTKRTVTAVFKILHNHSVRI